MPGSLLCRMVQSGQAPEVLRAFEHSGVRLPSLGLSNNPLAPGQKGEGARQHCDWVIGACEELGVDTFTTSTDQALGLSWEHNWHRLAEVWLPIVARAAANHIKIAFENYPHGYPMGVNLAVAPSF